MGNRDVVVFTCNWNAYGAFEAAGHGHHSYPQAVRPLKVMCLGRMNPGLILKAFEQGAAGVLLLGCPPRQCRYQIGDRQAADTYNTAKSLLNLLGYQDHQLQLAQLPADHAQACAQTLNDFVSGLTPVENVETV